MFICCGRMKRPKNTVKRRIQTCGDSVDEMPKNFYKIILTANPDRLPEVEEF